VGKKVMRSYKEKYEEDNVKGCRQGKTREFAEVLE